MQQLYHKLKIKTHIYAFLLLGSQVSDARIAVIAFNPAMYYHI